MIGALTRLAARVCDPLATRARSRLGALRHPRTDEAESGQISLLSLGFALVAIMLIIVGVDITAVQLARTQLWDAADGAALDAADSLSEQTVYAGGLGVRLPLDTARVAGAASAYLSVDRRPRLVDSWSLGGATGSPDGETAVVQLVGHVELPMLGQVVSAFSGGVTVTVTSRARSTVLDAP